MTHKKLFTTGAVLLTVCSTPLLASGPTEPPRWFLNHCGGSNPDNWCAEEAAEEGWRWPLSGGSNNNKSGEGKIRYDQSGTSEVRLDAYLNAELTGSSGGFRQVTMAFNDSGEVGDELFRWTFRISSNSDHEIQIWYDAILVGGVCVPVFDSEGSGSVAGEADVIGGSIALKVGSTELFSASAGATLGNATENTAAGVTLRCEVSSETGVDVAVATVTNSVASTFSREYTLEVTAFGENGSIIFADGDAINAGEAPAGQYDNDILIAAGTLNTYSYDDENDRYAGASSSNDGAEYYGDDDD